MGAAVGLARELLHQAWTEWANALRLVCILACPPLVWAGGQQPWILGGKDVLTLPRRVAPQTEQGPLGWEGASFQEHPELWKMFSGVHTTKDCLHPWTSYVVAMGVTWGWWAHTLLPKASPLW